MDKNTAFARNLEKRGKTMMGEFEDKVAQFVENLIQNEYKELTYRFPTFKVYYDSGSNYDRRRVRASFNFGTDNGNIEAAREKFEQIAINRFDENLKHIAWAIENNPGG